jgi:hypothetical protein
MANTGVEVQRQGDQIKLIMPGNITFATDSANIAPSFYSPLNNLAGSFKQFNQNTIEVVGFTDSTGSRQHNMDLSQRRAQAVSSYLTSQGVDASRVTVRGMGPDQPIASNADANGRAQNRRVEVNLKPIPASSMTRVPFSSIRKQLDRAARSHVRSGRACRDAFFSARCWPGSPSARWCARCRPPGPRAAGR